MRVYLSPQRSDEKIDYAFNGEVVTATYKGITDTFDFSGFPEGARFENAQTSLEINPILDAKRENGVLHVKLLNFIGENASEEEKFPVWQEV